MYDHLNVTERYRPSYDIENLKETINKLYSMTCEMKDINENDINVYEKAKELDKFCEEKKGRKPKNNGIVYQLILKEYKLFNPTDWNKFLINPHKFDTKRVASELLKENCILISEYVNGQTPIQYKYNGKIYYVKFAQWKYKKYRPHLGQFPGAHEWDEYHIKMGHNMK